MPAPAAGWQIIGGNFTGKATADLFGYRSSDGTLWVGENTGSAFSFTSWGVVPHIPRLSRRRFPPSAGGLLHVRGVVPTPMDDWQFIAGDFIGNGRTDVLGYHPSDGTLWVGENTGSAFSFRPLGMMPAPAAGWQIIGGNFTGKATADLFGYRSSDGTLWVGENTGSAFSFTSWGVVPTPMDDWQFIAGDFIGNGRTDVLGYHPSDGTLWVGENTGSAFSFTSWGVVPSPAASWQFVAGDFTSIGHVGVVGYHTKDGWLWVGENTGSAFRFMAWGNPVTPFADWQFVAGRFDADNWLDVVGYHPSDGSLALGKSMAGPIEGYCWPLSGAHGETIEFMLSGKAHQPPSSTSKPLLLGPSTQPLRMARRVLLLQIYRPYRSTCGVRGVGGMSHSHRRFRLVGGQESIPQGLLMHRATKLIFRL